MKTALKIGLGFGLTSGIITTLGLIVGLNAGTHSPTVVISGILTIAIADSFSDALGIHVSQESQNDNTSQEVWLSTLVAFIAKFISALTFIVPLIYLPLAQAMTVNILWGFIAIFLSSYFLAGKRQSKPWRSAVEHLIIGLLVVVAANYVGDWIANQFG